MIKAILTPVLRFFYRVRVEGLDHVPTEGPAILAGNHLSFIDSIFLPLVLRRRITFVAKAEYFDDPRTAWFFRAVGQIPIRRGGGSASRRALETAREVLEAGRLFGIYPEGTRSRDGRLYRGKTGVAWLALKAGCPIVPAALAGTQDIQPVGTRIPRVRKVSVQFGEPIQVGGRFDGMPMGRARRVLTDEVMDAVHALSGQELAGVYNERPKHPPGATEA